MNQENLTVVCGPDRKESAMQSGSDRSEDMRPSLDQIRRSRSQVLK